MEDWTKVIQENYVETLHFLIVALIVLALVFRESEEICLWGFCFKRSKERRP